MDSNNTISKINQTRYNLRKYLESEWDVSVIHEYSNSEIEHLYKKTNPKNNKVKDIGKPTNMEKSITPIKIKPNMAGSINSEIIFHSATFL